MKPPETSAPPPRRRGRLPAAVRQQREREILQIAMGVIVERGYPAATMQVIAEEAGASKETLYSWFGNREALVGALISANADQSVEAIRSALAAPVTDRETASSTLQSWARALLAMLTGEPSIALNRAAMSSPELAAELLASGRHRVAPLAVAYLEQLQDAGLIEPGDPEEYFSLLYGLVIQDSQIRTLLGEPAPSEPEIRARASSAVATFLSILRPTAGVA